MNIVVTGASRGIGKAIAEAFIKDGGQHTIVICSRKAEPLEVTAAELRSASSQALVHSFAADISTAEGAAAFGQFALQQCNNEIDVLVNNAGLFLPGTISNEEQGVLEKQISTNLYSAYYLTRSILPAMKVKQAGHIFFVCSVASLKAYANGGAYSISKFALDGLSKNLREELRADKIKVTAVYPGAVMTDSWQGFDNSDGRIMLPEDVAKMIYAAAHLSPQACAEEIILRPVLGDL